jgi:hypothetical protein
VGHPFKARRVCLDKLDPFRQCSVLGLVMTGVTLELQVVTSINGMAINFRELSKLIR